MLGNMAELPYKQTFHELTRFTQPAEFHDILAKSERLLDTAHYEHTLPEPYRNSHLQSFVDAPEWVQSFWEIEKSDNTYPRDRLAINLAREALTLSISYGDLQPNRSLTIGKNYAHITEQHSLHAQNSHRELRREFLNEKGEGYIYNSEYTAEQLAQFNDHLDSSIALLGLTYAMRAEDVSDQEAA